MAVAEFTFAAGKGSVSGLLDLPEKKPLACYVLAHGAGAGMRHPFLAGMARQLALRGIATLRYQFPYMEAGGKRPDTPAVAHAAVRAAVAEAGGRLPGVALFAGGKSFGGRMTSQAEAAEPLPGVKGLIFLGFPLHPAGKPSNERAAHLAEVRVPMLFLQGTRDDLATLELLKPVVSGLGKLATLQLVDGGNHSFQVPKASGRSGADVLATLADDIAGWIGKLT